MELDDISIDFFSRWMSDEYWISTHKRALHIERSILLGNETISNKSELDKTKSFKKIDKKIDKKFKKIEVEENKLLYSSIK